MLVRLAVVEQFEQRVPVTDIAAELRVSERSVQRWRRAREDQRWTLARSLLADCQLPLRRCRAPS